MCASTSLDSPLPHTSSGYVPQVPIQSNISITELFVRTLPKDFTATAADVVEEYLNAHTSYPTALKRLTDRSLFKPAHLKEIFIHACIHLNSSQGNPKTFKLQLDSHVGFYFAYKNRDQKITMTIWDGDVKKAHSTFDQMISRSVLNIDTGTIATFHCMQMPHRENVFLSNIITFCRNNWANLFKFHDPRTEWYKKTYIPLQTFENREKLFDYLVGGAIVHKVSPSSLTKTEKVESELLSELFLLKEELLNSGYLKISDNHKKYLDKHTTYPKVKNSDYVKTLLQISELELQNVFLLATFILLKAENQPTNFYWTNSKGTVRIYFIVHRNNEGKINILWWSGHVSEKSLDNSLLGLGQQTIVQKLVDLECGKSRALKHARLGKRARISLIIMATQNETDVLERIKAMYGKIKGLQQPPMCYLPPQIAHRGGFNPLLICGRIEKEYPSSLLFLQFQPLNKAQKISLFRSFANVLSVVHLLNNAEGVSGGCIFNGDLKIDNLLCSGKNDEIKLILADFSHSKTLHQIMIGEYDAFYAEGYFIPTDQQRLEILVHEKKTEQVKSLMMAREVYALGHILQQILREYHHNVPINFETLAQESIKDGFAPDFYKKIIELSDDMKHVEPENRPSHPEAKRRLLELLQDA